MISLGVECTKAEEIVDLTEDIISIASSHQWTEGAIFLVTTVPGTGLCLGSAAKGAGEKLLASLSALAKDPALKGAVLGSCLILPVSGNAVRTEGQAVYFANFTGAGRHNVAIFHSPFRNA